MKQGKGESLEPLITLWYDTYFALFGEGSEELASVAAAATINNILADREKQKKVEDALRLVREHAEPSTSDDERGSGHN